MLLHRFAKPALLLATISLLSACSSRSLEELRTASPKGTPFQAALAARYLEFSEDQAKRSNWQDSKYFADKGLVLAYGDDAEPEDPEMWNVGEQQRPEMQKAYAELLGRLTPENKIAQPKLAADAQYYYDCWVERQARQASGDDIAACHENFTMSVAQLPAPVEDASSKEEVSTVGRWMDALTEQLPETPNLGLGWGSEAAPAAASNPNADAELITVQGDSAEKTTLPAITETDNAASTTGEATVSELPSIIDAEPIKTAELRLAEAVPSPTPSAPAAVAPSPMTPSSTAPAPSLSGVITAYLVYFAYGTTEMNDKTARIVDAVVAEIKKQGSLPHIVLNGHTDTKGRASVNMTVSRQRAEIVRKALIERGIPEKHIEVYGFGETDQAVPTKDNVKEPANRRVEIIVNQ